MSSLEEAKAALEKEKTTRIEAVSRIIQEALLTHRVKLVPVLTIIDGKVTQTLSLEALD